MTPSSPQTGPKADRGHNRTGKLIAIYMRSWTRTAARPRRNRTCSGGPTRSDRPTCSGGRTAGGGRCAV